VRARLRFWQSDTPPPPPAEDAPPPLPEVDLIRRGDIATRLLADPFFLAIFEEIKGDIYRTWLTTKPSQVDLREEQFKLYQGIVLLEARLRGYKGAAMVRVAQREAEAAAEKANAAD